MLRILWRCLSINEHVIFADTFADTSKCLLTEYLDNQGGLLTTDKNIYTAIASAQSV